MSQSTIYTVISLYFEKRTVSRILPVIIMALVSIFLYRNSWSRPSSETCSDKRSTAISIALTVGTSIESSIDYLGKNGFKFAIYDEDGHMLTVSSPEIYYPIREILNIYAYIIKEDSSIVKTIEITSLKFNDRGKLSESGCRVTFTGP